jgi:pimeloyl-ACP methyl ester carboxylesterase
MVSKLLTSSDGTTIYAEAFGDASKPAIVFIHGYSLSSRVWADLFKEPELANNFYLVRHSCV